MKRGTIPQTRQPRFPVVGRVSVHVFQSLEKIRYSFPIVGKKSDDFSNRWKSPRVGSSSLLSSACFILLASVLTSHPAFGQGSESFDNFDGPGNTYTDGSFVGDTHTWQYSQMRNIGSGTTYSIDGQSVGSNNSGTRFVKTTVQNGVGTVSYKTRSYFTGGGASDRTWEVWVDGVQQDSFTLPAMGTIYEVTVEDINVEGEVELEFRSTGSRQIVIDTISWTGFPSEPLEATLPYSETFETDLSGVLIQNVSGPDRTWGQGSGGGRTYAEMNGFNTGDIEEDWLILPGIDFDSYNRETMTFETERRFGADDADNFLKLLYSADYDGLGDPTEATWTEISFTQPSDDEVWTESGEIDLSGLSGDPVYLAFQYRYEPGNYRRWRIANIEIFEGPLPPPTNLNVPSKDRTSFTAAWDAVPGADEYRLDVSAHEFFAIVGAPENIIDEPVAPGVPISGWTANDISWETADNGYARFDEVGSYLETPALDLSGYQNVELSFEVAKWGGGTDGPITVSVSTDGGATFLQVFDSPTPTSSSYLPSGPTTITALSDNVVIRFSREASPSRTRLRNILMTGEPATPSFVPDYEDRDVGLSTSELVTGLDPDTTYYFRLRSVEGAEISENSATASVTTDPIEVPTLVADPTSSNIGSTTATLGGEVTDTGGATVEERGVFWSTSSGFTPPGEGTKVDETGSFGTESFTVDVTSLPTGSTIYFRSYAENSAGFGFSGNQGSILTIPGAPTATAASSETAVSFTANWEAETGATSYRIDVAEDSGFTTMVSGFNDEPATGTSLVITGLQPETTYHYRVRAVNASGTSDNSNVIEAETTEPLSAPSVDSPTKDNIGATTATLGATVIFDGNEDITDYGVVWGTSSDPNIVDDNKVQVGTSTPAYEPFTTPVTGLPSGSEVFYRGYAVNAQGVGYSPTDSFFTEPAASPSGVSFTAVGTTSMTINWSAAGDSDGSIVIVRQGSAVTATPTDGVEPAANASFGDGANLGSSQFVVFRGSGTSVTVTDLNIGATYHVAIHSFAGGGADINYRQASPATDSQQTNFDDAVVVTGAATELRDTSVTLAGNVTSAGGGTISERGVVIGTSPDPTTSDLKVEAASAGTGSFIVEVSGLDPDANYHYRAYAINEAGTAYGDDETFTTAIADALVYYTFTGETASPEYVEPDVTATALSLNSGTFSVNGTAQASSWTGSGVPYAQGSGGWNENDQASANYFEFTIEADSGLSLTLDNISFLARRTAAGPDTLGISIGGVPVAGSASALPSGSTDAYSFSLSGYEFLEGPVLIRIQGWGETSGAGDFRVDDILVQGDIAPPPPAETPTVALPTFTNVEDITADANGNVTFDGRRPIVERGFYWSETQGFDADNEAERTKVSELGAFGEDAYSLTLIDLPPETIIYVKAFAINSAELEGRSAETSFETEELAPEPPAISAPTFANVGEGTALLGGNVTDDGRATVTERGIKWSTTADFDPEATGTEVLAAEGGLGVFTVEVSGLPTGERIYFHAYAENEAGRRYSDNAGSFRTAPGDTLAFYTFTGDSLAPKTVADDLVAEPFAVSSGSISFGWVASHIPDWEAEGAMQPYADSGGGWNAATQNDAKHFLVQLEAEPGWVLTITNIAYVHRRTRAGPDETGIRINDVSVHTESLVADESIQVDVEISDVEEVFDAVIKLDGWAGGTGAYRVDNVVIQGVVTEFIPDPPTVADTPTSASIIATAATLGGEVTDTGGADITERGIYWSTTEGFDPDVEAQRTKVSETGTFGTGSFTLNVTGLSPETDIYFRAFAVNSTGEDRSDEGSFATPPPIPPVVENPTRRNIGRTTADLGGEVTDDRGVEVTDRGVYWSEIDGFDWENAAERTEISASGSFGEGDFDFTAESLPSGELLYYRAFAVNSGGLGVTDQDTFVTRPEEGTGYFTGFEGVSKGSYAAGTITLSGIQWELENALIGSDEDDRKVGDQSVRIRHQAALDGTLTMVANKSDGVAYATFLYAHSGFSGDENGITFTVDYSIDNGANWTPTNKEFDTAGVAALRHGYVEIFAPGNVRIRFRTTDASDDGRRANIDNVELHDFVPATVPLLAAPTVSGIGSDSATLGATITASGGETVTESGTVWGEAPEPTGNVLALASPAAIDTPFSHIRSDMPPGTRIYFRGYADNLVGRGYSPDGQFVTTSLEPSAPVAAFTATEASATSVDLEWTAGGGAVSASGYLILQRTDAAPTGIPSDRVVYEVDDTIGDGTVVAVIDGGASDNITISELQSGITHHFVIFPFNDNDEDDESTNYRTADAAQDSVAVSAEVPSTHATDLELDQIETTSLRVNWTVGTGARRAVVMRAGAPVNQTPSDGIEYTADDVFGSGDDLGDGNYVVYADTGNQVTVTGLSAGTAYYVAIFEYSGTGAQTAYRTESAPTIARNTLGTSRIVLSGTTYSENFNNVSTGLPLGMRLHTGSTESSLGTQVTYDPTAQSWSLTAGGFKNMASAIGLNNDSETGQQASSTNRVIGVRQSGTFGDPGAAFVFVLEDTDGVQNIEFDIDLMVLSVQSRQTEWTVDYRVGEAGDFNTIGSAYLSPTTGGDWGTTPFSAQLGADADNQAEPVYIRVVALTDTSETGPGGARDSFGVDNLALTYDRAPPRVQVPASQNIQTDSADLGGNITTTGGEATVSRRGVYWSTIDGFDPDQPSDRTIVDESDSFGSGAFTVSVSGLSAGVEYYFVAFAENAFGEARTAQESFVTRPPAPVALAATDITDAGFRANWEAANTATHYLLDVSTNSLFATFEAGYEARDVGDVTTFLVTGLSDGTEYFYRLRAANSSGAGPLSNVITLETVTEGPPSLIDPTVTGIGTQSATLGATIASDGARDITDYGTVWGTSSSPTGNQLSAANLSDGVFTHVRESLPTGELIYFRGFAENELGLSYSADSSFYTRSALPNSHVGSFSAAPGAAAPNTSVDLTWTAATGADGYIILMRTAGAVSDTPAAATAYAVNDSIGDSTVVAVLQDGSATGETITDLTAGTEHHFAVFPFGYNGTNDETYNYRVTEPFPTASTFTTVAPPTSAAQFVTFNEVGLSSMTIGWSSGDGARRLVIMREGGAISTLPTDGVGYAANAEFSEGDPLGAAYVVYNGTGDSVTVTGLSSDTVYHVAVIEFNGANETANYLTDTFATGFRATLSASRITLTSALSYEENFNSIDTQLPTGVRVYTNATSSSLGSQYSFIPMRQQWGITSGAFWNFAATNGLSENASATAQEDSANRALGIRQVAAFGDPGAAFVFVIDGTEGYRNIQFGIDLLMLSVQPRSTTWTIDYRVGESSSFTPLTTWEDPNAWGSTRIEEALGADADNQAQPVYVRVAALSPSSGSGARDSMGLDNLELTYDLAIDTAPILANPSVAAIDSTSATLGAQVTGTGGQPIVERGTVWNTSGDPVEANELAEGDTATGVFSHSRSGLPAGTEIFFRGYADNSIGRGYSPVASFFTLSEKPTAHVQNLTASAIDSESIFLSWSEVASADGYLVLMRAGDPSTALPDNGAAYTVGESIGDSVVVGVVTPGSSTTASISGLNDDTTYYFRVFAFAFDGTNPETYHYRTSGTIPSDSDTTLAAVTIIEYTFPDLGAGSSTVAAQAGLEGNIDNEIELLGSAGPIEWFGGASSLAASASGWDSGAGTKYWQISFSTEDHAGLTLSSQQRGSAASPREFAVEYSLDGSAWFHLVDVPNVTEDFADGVLNNQPLPAVLENRSVVYLRWVMRSNARVSGGGGVTAAGVSRIDNISVRGIAAAEFEEDNLTINVLTINPEPANPWSDLTVSVEIENNADVSAETVLLAAAMGENIEFIDASMGGNFSPGANGVSWEVGELDASATVVRVLTVQPQSLDDVVITFAAIANGVLETESIAVSVSALANATLEIESINNRTVRENQSLTFSIRGRLPGNLPSDLTMTAMGLPSWASFSTSFDGPDIVGTFTANPGDNTVGVYPIQFTLTDEASTPAESISQVSLIYVAEPSESLVSIPDDPQAPSLGVPESQVGWTPGVTSFEVNTSTSEIDLEWEAAEGITYSLYVSEDLPGGSMSWTPILEVSATATNELASGIGLNESAERQFFAVAPTGQSPTRNVAQVGVVRRTIPPGFSLQAPPLESDGDFTEGGELGAILADYLTGNNNVGEADRLHVYNPSTTSYQSIYLNSSGQWLNESDDQPTTLVLEPGQGFFIERRTGSSAVPVFAGRVGNNGSKEALIQPGWNIVALSEGKQKRVNNAFESTSGAQPFGVDDITLSDRLIVQDSDGSWLTFHRGPNNNWTGSTSPSYVLQPGTAYYYYRADEQDMRVNF